MRSSIDLSELRERIHREIPLSSHMQVRVEAASLDRVHLSAPLAPNRNPKGTAFGGSVHSLAVLSCWALVNVALKELEREGLSFEYVVIQDSQIDYREPVETDFSARAAWSSESDRNKFLMVLRKKGRARCALTAEVFTGRGVCAVLTARFASQLASTAPASR